MTQEGFDRRTVPAPGSYLYHAMMQYIPEQAGNVGEKMMAPLVSVIMPCYKMGQYIDDALASVGAQSYTNWELLAVDDCGPEDGTRASIMAFAQKFRDYRVEYIRHDANKGRGAARNTAIRAARGELLAFLDPDDKWGPNFLEVHAGVLSRYRDIVLSYTDARYISAEGEISGDSWGPSLAETNSLLPSLYVRNFINPSTIAVRRHAMEQCNGFEESRDVVEDWDLWLRLLSLGFRFHYAPTAVSYYRKHPVAATSQYDEMRLRIIALREKHLAHTEYRHFMASYISKLEGTCQGLMAQLAEPWHAKICRKVSLLSPIWAKRLWRLMRSALNKKRVHS